MGVNSIGSNISILEGQVSVNPIKISRDSDQNLTQSNKNEEQKAYNLDNGLESNAPKADKEKLTKTVDQLNKIIQAFNTRLSFFLDDASGRFGVKIIDTASNKVIKQIPTEEVLALSAKIQKMIGLLFDEKS